MNIAAILAGGTGTRMGAGMPKQFIRVNDRPLIAYTIDRFQKNNQIDVICLVCVEEYLDEMKLLVERESFTKVKFVISGGANRQESSFIAVSAMLREYGPEDVILIHDGARPNVDDRIIEENIKLAQEAGACNTVIPSQDTILMSQDGQSVLSYTDRSMMYLVQTPQSFILKNIYDAHLMGKDVPGITDDCSLVLRMGGQVRLVQGDKSNVKVTTPEDLKFVIL